jgi:two-component system, cell cycle sensor histidine kinase and response regulator CckA
MTHPEAEARRAAQAVEWIDRLPFPLLVLDEEGLILRTNPALHALVGESLERLAGRPVEALEEREIRDRLPAPCSGTAEAAALPAGEPFTAKIRRADGSSVAVTVSLASGGASGSSVLALISAGATHPATDAAGSANDRFRRSMEMSPAGMYRSTMEGKILECNQAFARIFGYASPAELEGTDTLRLFWSGGDRGRLVEQLSRERQIDRAEIDGRRRDGRRLHLLGAGRLVEGDGQTFFEATLLDVSDLRRAEEELREREVIYRSLIESTRAVIWRADARNFQFTFASSSAERLLGFPVDRWTNEADFWTRQLHPDDREEAIATRQRETAKARDHMMEYRMLRQDGRAVWIQDSATVILEDGQPVALVGALVDTSHRKSLEEQLLQSQRVEAVGRLAGGIAHDFNNLIGVISGYAELLLDEREGDDRDRAALEEIRGAAARASVLTRQLLAFSRRQVLRPRPLDLNRLVLDFERMIRRVIGEDVVLEAKLQGGLWTVEADPVQMEQVLLNLAVNARDAMPEGGRLEIETANVDLDDTFVRFHPGSRHGNYVQLAMRDTGVGMTPEVLGHVFEPFFTTKEIGKGTGLGLSTVYGIVKQSGGYIVAASRFGEGSEFIIYLPRQRDVDSGEIVLPKHDRERLRGTETILVVEDSQSFLRLVREILTRAGYRVVEADSPAGAIERFRRRDERIDLLLTDLVMPGMSGRELARALSALDPDLRVIFMSGYSPETIGDRSPAEPELLQKPFSSQDLLELVREALARPPAGG